MILLLSSNCQKEPSYQVWTITNYLNRFYSVLRLVWANLGYF